MSTDKQTIICRKKEQYLKTVNFKHNDLKYKLIGWNTDRNKANKGIVEHEFNKEMIIDTNQKNIRLYAVWQERKTIVKYSNLTISANNIAYNQTKTTLTYSVKKQKFYEGITEAYSTETITGIEYDYNLNINENKVFGNDDISTSSKLISIKYDFVDTDLNIKLTANTTITQSGYTPIYTVKCISSEGGTIECYQNGKKLNPIEVKNNISTYKSSSKNFVLKAVPISQSKQWIAKKGCSYYNKPSEWYKHEGRTNCGSYQFGNKYKFYRWKHNETASSDINISGIAGNTIEYTAYFKMILLENAIIGSYRTQWTKYGPDDEEYIVGYTQAVRKWIPTCKTDTKRANKGKSLLHTGKSGHGYYKVVKPSEEIKSKRLVAHKMTNTFIANNKYTPYSAPYNFTIPEDGYLIINGIYGIDVYGSVDEQTGGFSINEDKIEFFEIRKLFESNFTSDVPSKTFKAEFNVYKDEKYQITSAFSSKSPREIGIYITSIELYLNNTPSAKTISDVKLPTEPTVLYKIQDDYTRNYVNEKFDNTKVYDNSRDILIQKSKAAFNVYLNNQWKISSIQDNDYYVYESFSNKGIHNSFAAATITFSNLKDLTFKIAHGSTDIEKQYDYVKVFDIDTVPNYYDKNVYASTKGLNQKEPITVQFKNIKNHTLYHYIYVVYYKDGSLHRGDDCGYLYIPKNIQNNKPDITFEQKPITVDKNMLVELTITCPSTGTTQYLEIYDSSKGLIDKISKTDADGDNKIITSYIYMPANTTIYVSGKWSGYSKQYDAYLYVKCAEIN